MAFHVDVVKNDWLAGIQYPLATIAVDDHGAISLDARNQDPWKDLVEELAGAGDPATALAELHTRFNGSHLFATEPHDDSHCPFHGPPVYLQGEQASGSASAVPAGR